MTILSDGEIEAAMNAGQMTIDGIHDGAVQPASIDLHLDLAVSRLCTDHPNRC